MSGARIDCLDGLRGLAAFWVLVGHMMLLTGFRLPLLSSPDLAVDLFILLSGFLMAYHAEGARDDQDQPAAWMKFWAKRYFRIAPVYYLTLAVALAAGPALYAARMEIAAILPGQAQDPGRYLDQSIGNTLAHLSFVFGQVPQYSYKTALPDWSIGLEMAFYAVFPFIMMAVRRAGYVPTALALTGACVAARLVLPDVFAAFAMPSFLPLKLNVFLAGMLIAGSLRASGRPRWAMLAVAMALAVLQLRGLSAVPAMVHAGCAGLLAVLADRARFPLRRLTGGLAGALSCRPAALLGEASYSVYLVHLLLVIPAAALAAGWSADPLVRFAAVFAVVAPIVYLLAWPLHLWVERPGIGLGRAIIRRRPPAALAPAE